MSGDAASQEKIEEYERRLGVLAGCLQDQVLENKRLEELVQTLERKQAKKHNKKSSSGIMTIKYAFSKSGSAAAEIDDVSKAVALEKDTFKAERQREELRREKEKLKHSLARAEEDRAILQRQCHQLEQQLKEVQEQQRKEREHANASNRIALDKAHPEETDFSSSSSSEFTEESEDEADLKQKLLELKDRHKREKKARSRMESLVFAHEEKIEDLKHGIRLREKRARMLSGQLEREKERRLALLDDVEKYEQRLITLDSELMESLRKEGDRRAEAEYRKKSAERKLSRLKHKLAERGLLSPLQSSDSTDSSYDSSYEYDEEEDHHQQEEEEEEEEECVDDKDD